MSCYRHCLTFCTDHCPLNGLDELSRVIKRTSLLIKYLWFRDKSVKSARPGRETDKQTCSRARTGHIGSVYTQRRRHPDLAPTKKISTDAELQLQSRPESSLANGCGPLGPSQPVTMAALTQQVHGTQDVMTLDLLLAHAAAGKGCAVKGYVCVWASKRLSEISCIKLE